MANIVLVHGAWHGAWCYRQLRQRCAGWGTRFSHQPIPAWASALIWRAKPLPSKPTFAT